MKVVIAGGTSVVGRALAARLRDAGHEVRVLSRSSDDLPADVTRPDSLRGLLEGSEVVYSLVGAPLVPWPVGRRTSFERIDRDGNLALLAEAERAGVDRFVYLSTAGEPDRPLVYVDVHRAVERALEASPLSSTSVRPTGFFGSLAFLESFRLVAPTVGDGTARTNPIHELDVADLLATLPADGPAILEAGGPEVLSRREISARLAGHARTVRVPRRLVRLSACALRPLDPRLAAMTDFFAWVLTHDAIAPCRGTRSLGG